MICKLTNCQTNENVQNKFFSLLKLIEPEIVKHKIPTYFGEADQLKLSFQ